jgi:hypothetical protein
MNRSRGKRQAPAELVCLESLSLSSESTIPYEALTPSPELFQEAPPAKKPKTSEVIVLDDDDDSPTPPLFNPTSPKTEVTQPEEKKENEPPRVSSQWKPRLAPCAVDNYVHDPHQSSTGLDDTWNYSPSMKGWVRMPCIVCGKWLTKAEQNGLVSYASKLPLHLKKDWSAENRWKLRAAAVCHQCVVLVRKRCSANPQLYNGRGTCYWLVPY